jgi:hypothetical protein
MRLDKAAEKIGKVMGEWKDKNLHSGKGGKVVKSRKQAIEDKRVKSIMNDDKIRQMSAQYGKQKATARPQY